VSAPGDGRRSGEGPRTALGKLFRTTAFKLSLAFLFIFTIFAFFILGYVAWSTRRVIDDQIVNTIEAEINGLSEQYRQGGIRRLVTVVERRARQPGASLYLVTTPNGERIVGNVGAVQPGALDRPGQREIDYGRSDDSDATPHRAIVRTFNLPGGFRLLVGRDVEERLRIREIIGRAFGWSLLLVGVLGCFGGWFVTRRVLKRVDAMTETTRTIMAGDLTGRLTVSGGGDELDRLAQNLNAMLERIGELMAGFKEVSDNIAHDLKTPLTRLRNKADEALRGAQAPEQLRAALETIIEDSDNLIRIFNALLMIARLEAGSTRETLADFDVTKVVRDVGELYEAVADESGAPLQVDVEEGLVARGSRELVSQAVANLIDNAVKYGAPAAGAAPQPVRVTARRNGSDIAIVVSDHGPGIPETERVRVLERFVRLESSRSRPGFGLGLSLAAGVARLHGGSLTLQDNVPGLRAVLSLPVRGSHPLSYAGEGAERSETGERPRQVPAPLPAFADARGIPSRTSPVLPRSGA
jgi:signal transduction histidine kinase